MHASPAIVENIFCAKLVVSQTINQAPDNLAVACWSPEMARQQQDRTLIPALRDSLRTSSTEMRPGAAGRGKQ